MGIIIGITGRKRNGKDEIANHLVNNHGFERYGFADPMKEGVKTMFDFNDEQLYGSLKEVVDERWGVTPRDVMQVFGTELCQYDLPKYLPALAKIGRGIWVHRFGIWYKNNSEKNIILSDCRFLHESVPVRAMGGEIWKVERPGYTSSIDSHASENELDLIVYDHLVKNDSTLNDLYSKVDLRLESYKLKNGIY